MHEMLKKFNNISYKTTVETPHVTSLQFDINRFPCENL